MFTPPKSNMEPQNDGFQVRNLLFQAAIFRFHVNLQGVYPIGFGRHPNGAWISLGFLVEPSTLFVVSLFTTCLVVNVDNV